MCTPSRDPYQSCDYENHPFDSQPNAAWCKRMSSLMALGLTLDSGALVDSHPAEIARAFGVIGCALRLAWMPTSRAEQSAAVTFYVTRHEKRSGSVV